MSTLRGPAQLADLQGALCVPYLQFNTTTIPSQLFWAICCLLPPVAACLRSMWDYIIVHYSAIPLLLAERIHHRSLLVRADICPVAIFCQPRARLRSWRESQCQFKRPIARQYSPTSLNFFLNNILVIMSLGAPNISIIRDFPF